MFLTAYPVTSLDPPLVRYDVSNPNSGPPLLIVFSDGHVVFRDAPGQKQSTQLADKAMNQLIDRLTSLNVLDLDAEALDRAVSSRKRHLGVSADIGQTHLEISLPNGRASFSLPATALLAERFPDIQTIKALRATEKLLLDLLRQERTN